MSNQKNELLLRVNDLEKQIRDSSIINDYLQRQNRDVVNELDKTKNELVEHTKVSGVKRSELPGLDYIAGRRPPCCLSH